MSISSQVRVPSEVIVIRRNPGEQEAGHKGGVWKIAYADFMTAMMAFFLVMWLINASEELNLTQIANYFNPLKLTAQHSSPKGLNDLQAGAKGATSTFGSASETAGKSKSDKRARAETAAREELLFKDPYRTLDTLAEEAGRAIRATRNDFSGGEVIRDPFDPEFRKVGSAEATRVPELRSTPIASSILNPLAVRSEPVVERLGGTVSAEAAASAPGTSLNVDGEVKRASVASDQSVASRSRRIASNLDKGVADEAAAIASDLGDIGKMAAARGGPQIEIAAAPEGVLIRLTDNNDFGMFAIASAEPRPELVFLMEKIANILSHRAGPIVLRGHTDGRQYRGATYDNWRLSTARAHMAYHMLVRGGIAETRFERIEGHADRDLLIAEDPSAAQNRRVEILLKRETS